VVTGRLAELRIVLVIQSEHHLGQERSLPAFPAWGRLGMKAAFRIVGPAMKTKIMLVVGQDGCQLAMFSDLP
jgi:hypothetical protein